MKKIIKPRATGAYAKLNQHGNQYDVFSSKGRQIGHVHECSDLIITASPKSFTQLSAMDCKDLFDVVIECQIQLGQETTKTK